MKLLRKAIDTYRNEGLVELIYKSIRFSKNELRYAAQKITNLVYSITDKYRFTGPENIYSNEYYEKRRKNPRRSDAHQVAKALNDRYEPNSVIDLGCAIGHYLEYFHNRDKIIQGVEGNDAALEYAVVPKENIEIHDLRDIYAPNGKYDLVICFEVAEHLSEPHVNKLLQSISKSGDIVAFTAAPPGQGGKHHVNEKDRRYWKCKFNNYGYTYEEDDVQNIRSKVSVEKVTEIPENLFIFKKDGS
ncbi:class I SAM-dependent methyltransferase [Natronolimnobius sp. AArcel1]|uniref:class I SAM-dependent methyltransferase n=1 Tax=Natronolimnobius sp. AArcel1 TaxID=1679093 RepID=UPI0013EBBFE0|nr:class I SAM-dependent methyltransferase [Natronolimnobius sp. AArcel1]NGM69088.1 class I SAM-dependent methyltransferase [Natronolimnobius sp. AArcel1]